MNILIATFSFPAQKMGVYDGKFVFSEAVAYAEAGARVRVVTPHFPGSASIERIHKNIVVYRFLYFCPASLQKLRTPGVPIYRVKSFLAFCQIPLLCLSFSLAILRHAIWADIIHAQWTLTALLALPGKWFLRRRIVLTARGSDLRKLPKWLNQMIHYSVDAAIDCFGPQPRNQSYRREFSGTFLKLPLIVHIDPCERMPRDMLCKIKNKKKDFIILYVGRFDEFKLKYNKLPIFELVNAAKILKDSGLEFHLFYVGGGDITIEKKIRALIGKLGVDDRVSLLGPKPNATDYMHFCHLGVGGIAFNAVSQEYTMLGKPQILIDLPDNRDTPWKHGENVIFSKPNSVDDLVQNLKWAIRNEKKSSQLGNNARQAMKSYITDSFSGGKVYVSAFEKLLTRAAV